jgi:dinuclear metal center YbgI/SA1388 family protein
MTITRNELQSFLDTYLNISEYNDYGPNGLQIEGKENIKKIAYAVSATRDSISKAVENSCDALIVHHGLFWKFHGPKTITGAFAKRVKPLIQNDINLMGYHLPLDAHEIAGNAVAIAKRINLHKLTPFGDYKGMPTGIQGEFSPPLKVSELKNLLENTLNHSIIVSTKDPSQLVSSIGIITGGANGYWTQAQECGLDAFLTGEISEHDWHEAQEGDIVFFAGGHNATEQFGVQELMQVIQEEFKDKDLEHVFIPSDNPA